MASLTAAEIIARVIGPIYVIVALGMLLNTAFYRGMVTGFFENAGLAYLGGFMALAFGLLILTFHYDWSSFFAGLITLLAWLAILEGAVLLIAPNCLERIFAPIIGSTTGLRVFGLGAAILGLYLSGIGYRLI